MKLPVLLLAFPALLAGCLGGDADVAPAATGQIDGAVVDQLLRPYANQTVHLVQLQRTDATSAFGGFTFREVPVGLYTVSTRLPTGETAAQLVDVEEDRVTRVILQLVPDPLPAPYFDAHAFTSLGERPQAGAPCPSCEWSVPLDANRPAEVTLEAIWDGALLVGEERDHLDITVLDGRGFPLYEGRDLSSPFITSIDGADLHPDARELRVQVRYGPGFTPSAQEFRMHSVLTLYHGATKAQMFPS